jgi:hypothetical protein
VPQEIPAVPRASLALALVGLRRLPGDPLTVGGIVGRLGEHSPALVLLLAGTLAVVPSPGLPVGFVFGSIALLVALRTAWRPGPVHLPRRLARRRVPRTLIEGLVRTAPTLLRRLERRSRPRLGVFVRGPAASLGYLMVALQALLVALPVPFGNTLPGIAIVLLALGLARGDGAVVAAGHVTGLVALLALAGLVAAGVTTLRLVG